MVRNVLHNPETDTAVFPAPRFDPTGVESMCNFRRWFPVATGRVRGWIYAQKEADINISDPDTVYACLLS